MNWIEEISNPQARQWEEFYRNRLRGVRRVLVREAVKKQQ